MVAAFVIEVTSFDDNWQYTDYFLNHSLKGASLLIEHAFADLNAQMVKVKKKMLSRAELKEYLDYKPE